MLTREFRQKGYRLIAALAALSFFGFAQGDTVEIEGMLNARNDANFVGKKNIRFTLEKGDQGLVLEVKKLASGNTALRINVQSGKHADDYKSVWVLYRPDAPTLKLIKADGGETQEPKHAKKAVATAPTPAVVEPHDLAKDKASHPSSSLKTQVKGLNKNLGNINHKTTGSVGPKAVNCPGDAPAKEPQVSIPDFPENSDTESDSDSTPGYDAQADADSAIMDSPSNSNDGPMYYIENGKKVSCAENPDPRCRDKKSKAGGQ